MENDTSRLRLPPLLKSIRPAKPCGEPAAEDAMRLSRQDICLVVLLCLEKYSFAEAIPDAVHQPKAVSSGRRSCHSFFESPEGPSIQLPAGSHIRSGDRLRVDYFHSLKIYKSQVPIDMSEPEVYEIWRRQIPLIEKYLSPGKYFLSMDEIRISGVCKACKDRHLPFFSKLGYHTLAGAYYDADNLDNPEAWPKSLDRTPGAVGIMYTSWRNKCKLLAAFGDLVSKR